MYLVGLHKKVTNLSQILPDLLLFHKVNDPRRLFAKVDLIINLQCLLYYEVFEVIFINEPFIMRSSEK